MGRRRQLGAAIVAVVIVGAVVALVLLTRGNRDSSSPSPSHSDPVATPGTVVVALTRAGDLIELSTADSSVRRMIVSFGPTADATSTPELAPDGSIWVGIDGEVLKVDRTTGAASVVAEGMEPRLSPDGRYLAYTAPDNGNAACIAGALTVRDLVTGREHTWARPSGSGADFLRCVGSLGWAPDGSLITFALGWESTSVVFLIDPVADQSARLDSRRLGPALDSSTSWRRPAFVGEAGSVVVQEMVPDSTVEGGFGLGRVLRVDLSTRTAVSEPALSDHADALAYSPSGDQALLLDGTGNGPRRLVHRDRAGSQVVLAIDVLGADW